ncbi:MAG: ATP/GTP-binding protein [Pseudolysinimonas sp.]|uniref:GTP-binding protein n=1 Tax=Pseudolysinimonas sp. TaxID=2680009 RepID=UPI0032660A13
MSEHVILFAGPMGAGKTTAIQTLSETKVIATEATNNDRETADKPTTTVALDYGTILLGGDGDTEDELVRLYGIPGQRRFSFMWSILKRRATGMVLLVHNDAPKPFDAMLEFLDEFGDLYDKGGIVVGITRADVSNRPLVPDYSEVIASVYPNRLIPVFAVDPRNADSVRMALMTLIANIEMRAMFRSIASGAQAAV